MIHLFFNCVAASAGAGLTYVRNVLPYLAGRTDLHATVALAPALRNEFGSFPNLSFVEMETSKNAAKRFLQEQFYLPRLIRRRSADVLISTGNFALRNSPVPQILLSGNSLYTSEEFSRDVRSRGDYGLWLDTRIKGFLAKQSVRWADCTIAPSNAFADELRRWSSGNVVAVHHGFDREVFFRDSSPLPREIQQRLDNARGALRLLFVSHYNYYRNFETLFRAIPILRNRLGNRDVKLFLTCRLRSNANPGSYRADSAAALIAKLGISENVVELGAVPYSLLHHLYQACHIYVTAAYAETFAHPLVEAMASGLPIVCSGIPTHREICRRAALYCQPFSPEEACEQIMRVAVSTDLARDLGKRGLRRSQEFSWRNHISELTSLAMRLCSGEAVATETREQRTTLDYSRTAVK